MPPTWFVTAHIFVCLTPYELGFQPRDIGQYPTQDRLVGLTLFIGHSTFTFSDTEDHRLFGKTKFHDAALPSSDGMQDLPFNRFAAGSSILL
jgi:hypothetical protein